MQRQGAGWSNQASRGDARPATALTLLLLAEALTVVSSGSFALAIGAAKGRDAVVMLSNLASLADLLLTVPALVGLALLAKLRGVKQLAVGAISTSIAFWLLAAMPHVIGSS